MTRFCRIVLQVSLAALLLISAAHLAGAATYPSKTIVITVHSTPGGGADILGRQLTEALKAQKINAVVENRSGGSGAINLAYFVSRPGDGYTLSLASASILVSRYIANLPLSFKDFKPVAMLQTEEYAVVSRSDGRWKTMESVVEDMKKNPGKTKLGGGMMGSMDSLVAFQFFKKLGLKPAYVPYENGADMTVALLGDQLELSIVNPMEALPQLKSGQFRVLAMVTEKRSEYFKDAPTLKELGIDVTALQWRGFWAPKSTPDEIVNTAAEFLKKAMQEPNVRKYMKDGMFSDAYLGPADFQASMERQDAALAQLIDELGLRKKK